MTIKTRLTMCHPAVPAVFLLGCAGCTMAAISPVSTAVSFVFAAAYNIAVCGLGRFIRSLRLCLVIGIATAVINPLVNHRGLTVLFYMGDSPITAEAAIFGICAAFMLMAAILWCGCISAVMTTERIMTLCSKRFVTLGLMLSMTLRLVPGLMDKGRELMLICPGKGIKKAVTVSGALMAGAMEDRLTTADSMLARGYGSGRRTCYYSDRMDHRDRAITAVLAVLAIAAVVGAVTIGSSTAFYPRFAVELGGRVWAAAGAMGLFMISPALLVR